MTGAAIPILGNRPKTALALDQREAAKELTILLPVGVLQIRQRAAACFPVLDLSTLDGLRAHDPEPAFIYCKALDVHLAVWAGRKVDQISKGNASMSTEAITLPKETLDGGSLVAGQKQRVPAAR
jgi:hypothetical protein